MDSWRNDSGGKTKYCERSLTHWHLLWVHGLSWDGTRAIANRGRRLAARWLSSYRAVNTLRLCYKKTTNQLVLFRERVAVCSEVHAKHINTLCGQNVEFVEC